MTGTGPDDEAHLAALLAVLSRACASPDPPADVQHLTPLQQWRARRLAAMSAEGTPRPSRG